MKAMQTIQDLIEEAKLRTVWWALCIFFVSYFLSHTSKSLWMNIPISVLLVSALRILLNEVDFRLKDRWVRPQTYLSHLEKKQLSVNDSRLSTAPPPSKWKRKIDSPIVEAAINDFIDKILKDFVIDLWYSVITPDTEFPEQIRAIIMDAIGEVSGRVKEINLVDLLTRDIIDLIGDHLDLFRRNQAAIGVDVMRTLSSEERDDRLKHHLMASKELHPALISPESEYKVLQRLMGGVITVVLRPREAQSPVIRSIARELLTCLVIQPVMNLASPWYINELIEYVLLAIKDEIYNFIDVGGDQSTVGSVHDHDFVSRKCASLSRGSDVAFTQNDNQKETVSDHNCSQEEPLQTRPADWARVLEAATQRRTEVLAPENLENMWTKGRNYKKKENKYMFKGTKQPVSKASGVTTVSPTANPLEEKLAKSSVVSTVTEGQDLVRLTRVTSLNVQFSDEGKSGTQSSWDPSKKSYGERGYFVEELEDNANLVLQGSKARLKRSNSTSDLKIQPDINEDFVGEGGPIISEFYSPDFDCCKEKYAGKSGSDVAIHSVGQYVPKLRCRVMGAYFEKLGSKSFAVYSISVTDAAHKTWFVKRRYRNFERLHRHLKDIPNYTLHLPPKRIFSSSMEDAFVHQRCIQLDKYLQDLLSIANVAEQHEVWDFLSVSSKNYSFGKSSSVMRTLAVNVDDAVDDIVRQFKGVSDGLMRKVVSPSSPTYEALSSTSCRTISWNAGDMSRHVSRQDTEETVNSFSDNEEGDKDGSHNTEEGRSSEHANGWHSDNELNSKSLPPLVIKQSRDIDLEAKHDLGLKSGPGHVGIPLNFSATSNHVEDPVGMPPEWSPPNVTVPLLNLVDKVFQLKRRGWIRDVTVWQENMYVMLPDRQLHARVTEALNRHVIVWRQVFWISKQILHLIMEDAIDDFLLRQIHWLRRDDTIAQGIRWLQDMLWPNGTFFIKIGNTPGKDDVAQPNVIPQTVSHFGGNNASEPSFEVQLEAARRASDVKKMLFEGAPTALVSLIGQKQYKRCASDIYYFTQSTVCTKQLAYAILELMLVSIFPELRNIILDVHDKMHVD